MCRQADTQVGTRAVGTIAGWVGGQHRKLTRLSLLRDGRAAAIFGLSSCAVTPLNSAY